MAEGNEDSIPKWALYCIMAGMLITGTCNTVVIKLNDEVTSLGVVYNHAYIQTAVMFLGELCCFPMYAVKLYIEKTRAAKNGGEMLLSPGG